MCVPTNVDLNTCGFNREFAKLFFTVYRMTINLGYGHLSLKRGGGGEGGGALSDVCAHKLLC